MRAPVISVLAAILACAACAQGPAGPGSGLADARAAQAMLGGASWSRVLRIENKGRRGPYPKIVYALAFELAGILWFYTDADGTQSLSLRRGRLAEDEADLGPLLRAIDPGFAAWEPVDGAAAAAAAAAAGSGAPRPDPLPNGCFIDSVAALRRLGFGGERADRPRLLSYYADTPSGRLGHTVLVYSTGDGSRAIDPDLSDRPIRLPAGLEGDPRALARYLRGGEVAAARVLAIPGPSEARPEGGFARSAARTDGLGPSHSSAS